MTGDWVRSAHYYTAGFDVFAPDGRQLLFARIPMPWRILWTLLAASVWMVAYLQRISSVALYLPESIGPRLTYVWS
jgi:hypothetical protein